MFCCYEDEVRCLDSARAPRRAEGAVVFYGSSSVRLWSTLARDCGDIAGPGEPANLGFGGSTLQACVHYFDRLVIPERP